MFFPGYSNVNLGVKYVLDRFWEIHVIAVITDDDGNAVQMHLVQ